MLAGEVDRDLELLGGHALLLHALLLLIADWLLVAATIAGCFGCLFVQGCVTVRLGIVHRSQSNLQHRSQTTLSCRPAVWSHGRVPAMHRCQSNLATKVACCILPRDCSAGQRFGVMDEFQPAPTVQQHQAQQQQQQDEGGCGRAGAFATVHCTSMPAFCLEEQRVLVAICSHWCL